MRAGAEECAPVVRAGGGGCKSGVWGSAAAASEKATWQCYCIASICLIANACALAGGVPALQPALPGGAGRGGDRGPGPLEGGPLLPRWGCSRASAQCECFFSSLPPYTVQAPGERRLAPQQQGLCSGCCRACQGRGGAHRRDRPVRVHRAGRLRVSEGAPAPQPCTRASAVASRRGSSICRCTYVERGLDNISAAQQAPPRPGRFRGRRAVYKASWRQAPVAVKYIVCRTDDHDSLGRAIREVVLSKKMSHPNVVRRGLWAERAL